MALRRLSTSSLTNPKWYRDGSAGLGPYTDFELIDETVLTTSAASVTFSNLGDYSTIYKHLQIRAVARSSYTSYPVFDLGMRFNGDSASNYSYHQLLGTGSSVVSENGVTQSSMRCGTMAANSITSAAYGATVIDILDAYSTTKNKTIRSLDGIAGATTNGNYIVLHSGSWRNTNAISSITLIDQYSGNFVAGSEFALFGIKGA